MILARMVHRKYGLAEAGTVNTRTTLKIEIMSKLKILMLRWTISSGLASADTSSAPERCMSERETSCASSASPMLRRFPVAYFTFSSPSWNYTYSDPFPSRKLQNLTRSIAHR